LGEARSHGGDKSGSPAWVRAAAEADDPAGRVWRGARWANSRSGPPEMHLFRPVIGLCSSPSQPSGSSRLWVTLWGIGAKALRPFSFLTGAIFVLAPTAHHPASRFLSRDQLVDILAMRPTGGVSRPAPLARGATAPLVGWVRRRRLAPSRRSSPAGSCTSYTSAARLPGVSSPAGRADQKPTNAEPPSR